MRLNSARAHGNQVLLRDLENGVLEISTDAPRVETYPKDVTLPKLQGLVDSNYHA